MIEVPPRHCGPARAEGEVNDTDARLWHPWLCIHRVLRVMQHTRAGARSGAHDPADRPWGVRPGTPSARRDDGRRDADRVERLPADCGRAAWCW